VQRPRAFAIGLAAMACEGERRHLPDDVDWSGEIVDVVLADEVSACEGDLVAIDRHARDVAQLFGTASDERVLVYWAMPGDVDEYCQPLAGGCALPEGAIATTRMAALHEVVHVLAAALGRSRPLWEEGLAEAMMPYALFIGENHPVAMLRQDPLRDLSYMQAGHFVRWAWRQSAERTLAVYDATQLRDDQSQALAAFDSAWGESLYEIGDRYREDAPDLMDPVVPFVEEPLLQWSNGELRAVIRLDCSATDTLTASPGMRRVVYLDIPRPANYQIRTAPAQAWLLEWPVTHGDPFFVELEGDDEVVFLEPGRYALDLIIEWTEAPLAVEVLARPVLSSQPTTPD